MRSNKDPVTDMSRGRAMGEVDLRAARHFRGTCYLEEGSKGAQVAWRRKTLGWDRRGKVEGAQARFLFSQQCHSSSCLTFKGDGDCRRTL